MFLFLFTLSSLLLLLLLLLDPLFYQPTNRKERKKERSRASHQQQQHSGCRQGTSFVRHLRHTRQHKCITVWRETRDERRPLPDIKKKRRKKRQKVGRGHHSLLSSSSSSSAAVCMCSTVRGTRHSSALMAEVSIFLLSFFFLSLLNSVCFCC